MPKNKQQHTPDAMQDATPAGRRRAAKGKKAEGSAADTDRPQCTGTKPNGQRCRRPPVRGGERCQKHGGVAKRTNKQQRDEMKAALSRTEKVTCTATKRNGERCSNPPVRGTNVCRMHGAGAPQVRAKANQRLVEMVLPAMRELHRILNNPHTADSDKLKAINMVLNRTGYNERQTIELGLREPNAWDAAAASAVKILRGMDNIVDPAEEPKALPPGGLADDDLEAFLAWRDQQRAQEAKTTLDNGDHDVIRGSVVDRDADIPGPIDWEARDRARSNRPSEFGGGPDQPPASGSRAYERAEEP